MTGHAFRLTLVYALAGVVGVAAFAYPFVVPERVLADGVPPGAAPVLTMLLLVLALIALLAETQGEAVSAKIVAALGIMVAVAAVLRFLETAVPGPGGFSPVFVPIILGGYVFGARFGFLMGALALFVSALVTGGIGPWLPYQIFVAAWLGLSAGWLPHPQSRRGQAALLAAFGVLWGFLYGFITNLYFWPFFLAEESMRWEPGSGFLAAAGRYVAFYGATSLLWDTGRALGNGLLLLFAGVPLVRALARFERRFRFKHGVASATAVNE
jgi:energy-coupling factor transport system substrate-specific component